MSCIQIDIPMKACWLGEGIAQRAALSSLAFQCQDAVPSNPPKP